MDGLRGAAEAEGRGLLRLLLLWRCSMPASSGSEGATAPHRLLLRFIGKEDACSGATAGRDRQCALGGSFIALFAAKPALIPHSRERASRLRREALLADGPKSLNFYEP